MRLGRHQLAAATAGVALCLLLGACGIPEDSEPRAIDELIEPTVVDPTATPPPAETQIARIFLLDANSRVALVEREVTARTIRTLLEELIRDPSEEETERSLTTAVPSGVEFSTNPSIDEGTALLDLNSGGLEILEGTELTQALSQIVWTLTNTANIDVVQILIEGESKTWIPPDSGEQTLLRKAHFASFDPEYVEPPTPTPAPTPTPTPEPTSAPGPG
jgi:hypothetical protein